MVCGDRYENIARLLALLDVASGLHPNTCVGLRVFCDNPTDGSLREDNSHQRDSGPDKAQTDYHPNALPLLIDISYLLASTPSLCILSSLQIPRSGM